MVCKAATVAMTVMACGALCGSISFVPGLARTMVRNAAPQKAMGQGPQPQGEWAMGLPAVAAMGLLAMSNMTNSSRLTRKTRICRQAEGEAKEAPVAEGEAKEAPVAKKAKPTAAPQKAMGQGPQPQGEWAMGLPAVAAMGLLAMSNMTNSSRLTRKTRICRQAEGEAKEAPVAEGEAKEAPVAKKAKPTPVCGSEWNNEVDPELSHPSGLYILPVEPAEFKGSYDYDNEYNQVPSETSVHASDTKWVPQCTPK
eukprot:CAMPEP_0172777416 /NCGR_PEP_ID=MMETSP1074-20121228/201386_1 /TAXON_ID=2916 /ORGANISM="Ceratium fusus, Strain PA161109" /LENGTH=253 /DNA_ID=CAMNT_0013614331 /DNA_START=96 /DNA_END=860 /DNA_ORIENTATION=-